MQTVQEVIRASPHVTDKKAKCYRDTSYTKTKKKVRFKFVVRLSAATSQDRHQVAIAKDLKEDLTAAGHTYDDVMAFDTEILVWQSFPIAIIEG